MFETDAAWLIFWWRAFMWGFPAFMWGATAVAIAGVWIFAARLLRTALLRTLEVAAIVEAAREAQRQGHAPILRAWTRLEKRWGNGR